MYHNNGSFGILDTFLSLMDAINLTDHPQIKHTLTIQPVTFSQIPGVCVCFCLCEAAKDKGGFIFECHLSDIILYPWYSYGFYFQSSFGMICLKHLLVNHAK